MDRKLYRHAVTGIETALSEQFAAVWGDRFSLIEDEKPKAKKSTPSAKADSTDDSSKEGNN